MTPQTFRKTLLALAITGTALSVQAQNETLNGSHLILGASYSDSVNVTGSQKGVLAVDTTKKVSGVVNGSGSRFAKDLTINATIDVQGKGISAIELWDTKVAGGLAIEGTLKVTGDEVFSYYGEAWGAHGIVVEGEYEGYDSVTYLNKYTSSVGGNIHNKGSISVEGPLSVGVVITDVNIGGDIVNEGSIQAKGRDYFYEDEDWPGETIAGVVSVAGVVVDGVQLSGNIHNKGSIRAEGTNAVGIEVGFGRIGQFINDGSIEATGKSANATFTDLNTGETESYRQVTRAAFLDSIISQVRNNEGGRIVASGEGSVGLDLGDAYFSNSGNEPQIINAGLIQGEAVAIYLEGANSDRSKVQILNRGNIVSGSAAIEVVSGLGDDPVDLRWEKGIITGDLLGLRYVEVLGSATFNRQDKTERANIELTEGGKLSVGTASMAGHLTLEQAHTQIIGDLGVATDSSLGLTLRTATKQNEAVLNVSGTAEFAEGSQIKLAAKGSDFDVEGAQYLLVKAGSLNGNPTVTSSSILLAVDTSKVEGNSIVATVTGKGEAEIIEVIVAPGSQADQGAVNAARAAEALAPMLASLPADDPIRQILMSGTEAEQRQTIRQLAPEVSGGASRVATSGQSMIRNVAASRTGRARGMSSGDTFQQTGVWVQALNSDATQDLKDGVLGYDASTTGIAVGADGKLNEQLTLGVAYSALNSDVDAEGGNKTEVTGHAFTLYSGFATGNYFVDGSLIYGLNDNEGKRVIGPTLAKAEYDSTLLGLNLTAGYIYPLQGGLVVEPQVTARYSTVEIDAIKETGSSAALNTAAQTYNMAELGAGARLVGSLPMGQGTLEPQLKAMVYQDLIGDAVETTSTFAVGGNSFVTTGADPETTSYEIGLGADYRLGALTLGVSYDYFGRSDYNSDTFAAKVRYDF